MKIDKNWNKYNVYYGTSLVGEVWAINLRRAKEEAARQWPMDSYKGRIRKVVKGK